MRVAEEPEDGTQATTKSGEPQDGRPQEVGSVDYRAVQQCLFGFFHARIRDFGIANVQCLDLVVLASGGVSGYTGWMWSYLMSDDAVGQCLMKLLPLGLVGDVRVKEIQSSQVGTLSEMLQSTVCHLRAGQRQVFEAA